MTGRKPRGPVPAAVAVLPAISYSMAGAVEATGIGETNIKAAVARGELVTHYIGRKLVILAADLLEWVQSLPTERETA